jgi:phage terminase Nu1 subunit (DNA packaging protein)
MGISMPTVTAWMGDGMPYVEGGGKGKPFTFETTDCLQWWAENKFRRKQRGPAAGGDPFEEGDGRETIDEAERRKMIANADKAELELAKAAGRVVLIEDVAAIIAEMHVRVRTRLLGIGNQARLQVRSLLGGDREAEERVVKSVEDVVSDAMAELRDDPFESEDADGGADAEE